MRAAHVLAAMATRYRVTLLVILRYASPAGDIVPGEIARLCAETRVARTEDKISERMLSRDAFDIVHVFRLGTVPFAKPWLHPKDERTERWLDLDDVESASHQRLAALHRASGDLELAGKEEEFAHQAKEAEITAMLQFDRIFLASKRDADRLPSSSGIPIRELPNVLRLPEPLPRASVDEPFTFLFVGTLGHFPNVDGLVWFADEILPIVQARSLRDFEVQIVGTGWSPLLAKLVRAPGVRIIGHVPDVQPYYGRANAVIVPLRAGGGTRIKVIEAFGYGRPVIGTTIGLEGIEAEDKVHALIGDDPDTFASSCLDLLQQPELRADLAQRALELARDRYAFARLVEIVRDL